MFSKMRSRLSRLSTVVMLPAMLAMVCAAGCTLPSPSKASTTPTSSKRPNPITFPLKISSDYYPLGLTAGQDGNLWITEEPTSPSPTTPAKIARVTLSGKLTEFTLPAGWYAPSSLAAGPDGKMWFSVNPNQGVLPPSARGSIGYVTPEGAFMRFPLLHTGETGHSPVLGPDGAVWFVVSQDPASTFLIGRITSQGAITEYPLPTSGPLEHILVFNLAAGPDGNMWFETLQNTFFSLDEISPSGQLTQAAVFTDPNFQVTGAMARGPDQTMWVVERTAGGQPGDKIARISQGAITEFTQAGQKVYSITVGPDGNIWFTNAGSLSAGLIGRIRPTGAVTTFPMGALGPTYIVLGPDSALWFVAGTSDESGLQLARFQVST